MRRNSLSRDIHTSRDHLMSRDIHTSRDTRPRSGSDTGLSVVPYAESPTRGCSSADPSFSTPVKQSGPHPGPCPDSPFQRSLLLRSPQQSRRKVRPCKLPECAACQARRARTTHRWARWKVLNQTGSPCETN